ncbi:DUF2127 domain-containing protein [Acidimangrovimonas pyrenivorans]|uniref:DUF2127 domain-containing protein n=1 Tax=Acidimangrovimonas pyrenivorans TaxID=2030798 RepID=UPI00366BAB8A
MHGSFLFGLGMQALIGTSQLLAAIVLQIAWRTDELTELANWTGNALKTQTPDPIAASLLRQIHDFSLHPQTFWSVYLIGHGLLNLSVVAALLTKKPWAHPVSMLVLAGFIAYQLDRYWLTHAPVLILLSVFDFVVILLVWNEHRQQRLAAKA